MGFWRVPSLFPARSENAARTSGTCNIFHGLQGDKLHLFKLLSNDVGLSTTPSMCLPDSSCGSTRPRTKPFSAALRCSRSFSSTVSLLTANTFAFSWLQDSQHPGSLFLIPLPSQDDPRQHLLFLAVSRGSAEHYCSNQIVFIGFLLLYI